MRLSKKSAILSFRRKEKSHNVDYETPSLRRSDKLHVALLLFGHCYPIVDF